MVTPAAKKATATTKKAAPKPQTTEQLLEGATKGLAELFAAVKTDPESVELGSVQAIKQQVADLEKLFDAKVDAMYRSQSFMEDMSSYLSEIGYALTNMGERIQEYQASKAKGAARKAGGRARRRGKAAF